MTNRMCLETRAGGRGLEAEREKLSVFAPDSSLVLVLYLVGLFSNGRLDLVELPHKFTCEGSSHQPCLVGSCCSSEGTSIQF